VDTTTRASAASTAACQLLARTLLPVSTTSGPVEAGQDLPDPAEPRGVDLRHPGRVAVGGEDVEPGLALGAGVGGEVPDPGLHGLEVVDVGEQVPHGPVRVWMREGA